MEAEKDTVISRDQDLAPLCTSMFWSQPPGGGKGPSLSRTATHPALLQWDPTGIRRRLRDKLGFRHLLDRKHGPGEVRERATQWKLLAFSQLVGTPQWLTPQDITSIPRASTFSRGVYSSWYFPQRRFQTQFERSDRNPRIAQPVMVAWRGHNSMVWQFERVGSLDRTTIQRPTGELGVANQATVRYRYIYSLPCDWCTTCDSGRGLTQCGMERKRG